MIVGGAVLKITTAESTDGATSQALSVALTANGPVASWTIVSGSNGQIEGSLLSLVDVTAPGTFIFTIRAVSQSGIVTTKSLTLTLTGAAAMGALTGVGSPTMGQTTATFTYTLPSGATTAQVAVNSTSNLAYTLDNTTKTLNIFEPETLYDFYLRATDGTNHGPWHAVISGTTLAVVVTPPTEGTTPLRAVELSDGIHVNVYLNRATGDPHTAYRTSDSQGGTSYTSGTWDTSGWVMGHWEPLAKVGIRQMRTSFGSSSASSHQTVQVPLKIFADCYGSRLDGTITQLTAAQLATAGLTGTSAETAITRAKNAYPHAMRSFQCLNEPNNTDEPWFNSSAAYPGGWRSIVIDHCIASHTKYNSFASSWPTDVTFGSFSLWKRDVDDIRSLKFTNYVAGQLESGFTKYTTASNKQWIRDCLPLVNWINLHYYTGGRKPTIAGTPGKQFSETGNPDAEITLDAQKVFYSELADHNTSFPIWMTENGWELGNYGLRTVYSDSWLTENARSKYFQRQVFDNLSRGIVVTCIFELMDNASQVPAGNTAGKVYGMLAYTQTAVNTYTFTRRTLYYITYLTSKVLFDGNTTTGAMAGTARTFTKTNRAFTLSNWSGAAVNGQVKHLLFQKSTGEHVLAIWKDSESWKRTSPVGETFTSAQVRITTPGSQSFRSTRPYTDAIAASTNNTWSGTTVGTTFDVVVYDDVIFVEIT